MKTLLIISMLTIAITNTGCQSFGRKEATVRVPQSFGRFPNAEMVAENLQAIRVQINRPILLKRVKKTSLFKQTFVKKGDIDDSRESFYVNDARCSIETQMEKGQLLNPEVVEAYLTEDYVLAFVNPSNDVEYGIRCFKEGPGNSLVIETPGAALIKETFQGAIGIIDEPNQ